MDEFFAVDLERDVNWGDSTYVCRYCCAVIAETAGYVNMATLQEQMNDNALLKKKLHNTRAKLEQRDRRLNAITKGATALKKEKKRAAA
jgi:hypothetical protein